MKKDKSPRAHTPATIESYAERLHALLGLTHDPRFNIISIVEIDLPRQLPYLSIEILERRELSVAAHTEFDPSRVLIREDVYEGAYRDDPKSRFTIAHEIGHLCLHWGYAMPRLPPESPRFVRERTKARVEAEANLFASAFLMPRAVALKFNKPARLANICGVSELAATIRLSNLLFPTDDLTTTNVLSLFGESKSAG
jgi:hypothetical protein